MTPGRQPKPWGPMVTAPGGYLAGLVPGTANEEDLNASFSAFDSLGTVGVKVFLEKGFGPREVWPLPSPEVRAAVLREAAARGMPIYVHGSHEDEQSLALDMGAHVLVHVGFFDSKPSDEYVRRVASRGTYVMTTLSRMDAALIRWHPERLDEPLVQLTVPEIERATARDPRAGAAFARAQVAMMLPELPGFLNGAVAWFTVSERQTRWLLENTTKAARRLHEAGVPLVVGSDAGNWPVDPYAFHGPRTLREMELLAEAGLAPGAVRAAATRVPARMLGLEAEIGTVEVGRRGDLVILRDDPLRNAGALRTILWTVKDGVAHTPEEWMSVPAAGAGRR